MEYIDAKNILTAADGSWFGNKFNVNIYRGCSHGCIYCDSRSDCYAIKRFDTVRIKRNALEILESELSHKNKKGIVSMGAMSDGYNPLEKETLLTRGALKLFDRYGFGVNLQTKSDLILRDIDVLKSIAKHSPVIVGITVTTPYDNLSKKIEPKAPVSSRRFEALSKLSAEGIYAGVMLTPVLPFIEDDSAAVISIVDNAEKAGCKYVYAGSSFGVTLRDSQRVHFLEKADKLFPGMKDRYCAAYGDDYYCISPNSAELYKTFADRCERAGMAHDMEQIVSRARKPYDTMQISLFDL